MSCLHYLCVVAHSDDQHILCSVFVSWYCVPHTACFSGLFIFDCHFGIL